MMTAAAIVEGGVECDVHVSARFGGAAEWVGHAVDGAASFDFSGAAEGGYAAGFVVFGGAFGAVHLDLLPQQSSILLHLFGKLYRFVFHAAPILIEVRAVEGGRLG